jgi:hypothetical protein
MTEGIDKVQKPIDEEKLAQVSPEDIRSRINLYSEWTHHAVHQPERKAFPICVVINGNSKAANGYLQNDWLDLLSIYFFQSRQ